MSVYAADSEHVLIAVLQHLERTGWNRADVDTLIDVYLEFQTKTKERIYGSILRHNRDVVARGLDADIKFLVATKEIQRSTSRIWLLPITPNVVFKIDMLLRPLLRCASAAFPPKA